MQIVDSRGALLRQTTQQPLLEAALGGTPEGTFTGAQECTDSEAGNS